MTDRVFRKNIDLDELIEKLQELRKNNPELGEYRVVYDVDKMNGWFDYRPIRGIYVDKEDEYILLNPTPPGGLHE